MVLANYMTQKINMRIKYTNPVYVEAKSKGNTLLYDIRNISYSDKINSSHPLTPACGRVCADDRLDIYGMSPLVTNLLQ